MYSHCVISAIQGIRRPGLDIQNRAALIDNLVFMQQLMRATEGLLQDAADAANGDLRAYYLEHLEEERGHAEWLANDLQQAGVSVEPLIRKAVEIAGAQYYLIKHVHPASLLGYMAVLEGCPTPLEVVEQLENLHGKDLFRTLRYHSEHDLHHRKDLFAIIDKANAPEILSNAVQTAIYISELTQSIEEKYAQR